MDVDVIDTNDTIPKMAHSSNMDELFERQKNNEEWDYDDISHIPLESNEDYIVHKSVKKRKEYCYDPSCPHI